MDRDTWLEQERLRTDPMEAKVYHICEDCRADIYQGNEFYVTDEADILCEDCIDKYLNNKKAEYKRIAGEN